MRGRVRAEATTGRMGILGRCQHAAPLPLGAGVGGLHTRPFMQVSADLPEAWRRSYARASRRKRTSTSLGA